ncbi:MAG: hypothetical protein Q7K16_02065 [Candidatus Azambacteria bacterium]|nr:hypothetical protein [Candidatus Azambacteria bacterium]
MKKAWMVVAVLFLIFVFVLSVDALADDDKSIDDIKVLAGRTWHGYVVLQKTGQKPPISLNIKDDGSYKAYGAFMVVGQITLADGKLSYQSSRSSGTITLHEDGKTQILRFWSEKGTLSAEFERQK